MQVGDKMNVYNIFVCYGDSTGYLHGQLRINLFGHAASMVWHVGWLASGIRRNWRTLWSLVGLVVSIGSCTSGCSATTSGLGRLLDHALVVVAQPLVDLVVYWIMH